MTRSERPMGDVSRRLHGVMRQLQLRMDSARHEADVNTVAGEVMLAASLRGKAHGYGEALSLLRALDDGRQLHKRNPFNWGEVDA